MVDVHHSFQVGTYIVLEAVLPMTASPPPHWSMPSHRHRSPRPLPKKAPKQKQRVAIATKHHSQEPWGENSGNSRENVETSWVGANHPVEKMRVKEII